MVKYLLILVFILGGCANPLKRVEIQKVEVPVNYCPAPPIYDRPVLPIDSISDTDTDGIVALKYEASIRALQLYSQDLETIINFYKKNSKK